MTVIWKYYDYRALEKLTNFLYSINRMTLGTMMVRCVRTNDPTNPYNYEIII